jgi:glutaminyl-peptide cyclotransferase
VLACHYDTKSGIGTNFCGANDSASGVGLALDLARGLFATRPHAATIVVAFLDGEECVREYDAADGLHGSRRMARRLAGDGRSRLVTGVFVLDMVGDRDLTVTIPPNSTPSLVAAIFEAAHAENARSAFSLHRTPILDDHVPFISAGMPAADVIDFNYGSRPGANDYWHTPQDTVDKLDARSLETVGRVVWRVITRL